ncbi:hypothetical protein [Streptomyces gibsoniae]|uniref:DUF4360 domain-containing protein n=1 Tax=Streptomyces gibsoniae TaxID=3075529 RepID=A0ABU2U6F9_9ACTN|nr:hypothetical protein [Streptomyces sp. DSM 41699]MDT0468813.1 hypothetical protein [Streptomyces sp. DSM 41699]
MNNATAKYTAYDEKNPTKVLGTGILTVSSSATLSATSGKWEEAETVTLTKVDGAVTALNVGFTASCTGSCTATAPHPWAGSPLLTEGQSVSGTVTYEANPGAGKDSKTTTRYDMSITQPGATPLNAHSTWSNSRQVRCDTTFANNTSTGCVISDVRAQLILPLSTYGAAAATYGWAEQNRLSCRFRGSLTRADAENTPYPGYVSTAEGTKRKNLDTACDLQGYGLGCSVSKRP